MKVLFNKSASIEERLSKLELVSTRLARRATERKVAIITPYPIANAVFGNVRDRVLSYMFNTDGTILKGCLWTNKGIRKGIRIIVEVSNRFGSNTKEYIANDNELTISTSEKVIAFDRLSVYVYPISEDEVINECWISFLWVPAVNDVYAKSYLMEEIERDVLKEFNEEVS